MRYRIKPHSSRPNVSVVEVFDDENRFMATIIEGGAPNILHVVSKHLIDAHFIPGVIPVTVVQFLPSTDPPAQPSKEDVMLEAAVIDLHRKAFSMGATKQLVLVRRTKFETIPVTPEMTIEKIAENLELDIIAVMDNLEVPSHVESYAQPTGPHVPEKGSVKTTEAAFDEVTIKCSSCGSEHTELAWKGNAGACPDCNVSPEERRS